MVGTGNVCRSKPSRWSSDVKHLPNEEPQVSHLHLHLEAIVGLSGHRPPIPSLPLAYGQLQSFLTTVLYLSLSYVRRSSPPRRVRQRTVLSRESSGGWSTALHQRRFSVPRCALTGGSIFVALILKPFCSSPCKPVHRPRTISLLTLCTGGMDRHRHLRFDFDDRIFLAHQQTSPMVHQCTPLLCYVQFLC